MRSGARSKAARPPPAPGAQGNLHVYKLHTQRIQVLTILSLSLRAQAMSMMGVGTRLLN